MIPRPLRSSNLVGVALAVAAGCRSPKPGDQGRSPELSRAAPISACEGIARWWRAHVAGSDSARMEQGDTSLVPAFESRTVSACYVRLSLPRGVPAGATDGPASDSTLRLTAVADAQADGPDGAISGFRGVGRHCVREQAWDGPDDSDPAAPRDSTVTETWICWNE